MSAGNCASWTFGSVVSNPNDKMKPMPIEGAAVTSYAGKASTWWGTLGMATKIAIGAASLTALILVIVLPIALSGGGDDDAVAASTALSVRVLNYTGACAGAGETLHYRTSWAASGDLASCVTTPGAADANWPFVLGESMTAPTLPAGYTNAGFSMYNDTATGNLHLRASGGDNCLTYYYTGDTDTAWWAGVSTSWAIVAAAANGAVASNTNPPCQLP
jgi:hypothetical protein